ncbi:MAG: ATP-binding protein [Thermoleophilia bacterium]
MSADRRQIIQNTPLKAEVENHASNDKPSKLLTAAEKIVSLGETAELFHAPDGCAYASVKVDLHGETWALNSKGFRHWLQRLYWREYRKVPGSQAMQDALETLAAMAVHDGSELAVHVRLAGNRDAVYVDLGRDTWEAVEITANGWNVLANSPVKFRRTKGMKPLPYPERGGSIDELRGLVNIDDEADFILYVGWLVGALNPKGPYPVLVLNGEQDSAKSTAERVARRLIDPYGPEFRSTPRDELNLVIGAKNNWVLAFDNLSHIQPWFSDALCRLATGGGYATRTLYANDEETLFEATRPIVLNGIGDIATRGDLLSRSLVIVLPPIPSGRRKSETDFWENFETIRPRILGALYDAVSIALRNLPNVSLTRLPRMADFATWVTAAEQALGWADNTFIDAYYYNRRQANELALEASPLVPSIRKLVKDGWRGAPTELLTELNEIASDHLKRLKSWPKSTKALTNELDRLAPDLRASGINIERGRDSSGRFWIIEKA